VTTERVYGNVPDDLYSWAKQKIKDGTYHNMSHVVKAGLMALRERDDSGEVEGSSGSGFRSMVPPVQSGDDQEESEGDQDDV